MDFIIVEREREWVTLPNKGETEEARAFSVGGAFGDHVVFLDGAILSVSCSPLSFFYFQLLLLPTFLSQRLTTAMANETFLFTSESVGEGHPGKQCDKEEEEDT